MVFEPEVCRENATWRWWKQSLKRHQALPGYWKPVRDKGPPQSPQRQRAIPSAWFPTSGLRNRVMICFYCFKPPILRYCLAALEIHKDVGASYLSQNTLKYSTAIALVCDSGKDILKYNERVIHDLPLLWLMFKK